MASQHVVLATQIICNESRITIIRILEIISSIEIIRILTFFLYKWVDQELMINYLIIYEKKIRDFYKEVETLILC